MQGTVERLGLEGWEEVAFEKLVQADIFRIFDHEGNPVLDGRTLIAKGSPFRDKEGRWKIVTEPDGYIVTSP